MEMDAKKRRTFLQYTPQDFKKLML